MQPVLKQTKNYESFELHWFNRDINRNKVEKLKKLMKRYGFRPHKSIDVIVNGSKKKIITDGHHRFVAAVELELPVWYTIAEDCGMSIQEEQIINPNWSMKDFLISYSRSGHPAYIAVENYVEETGIPLGLAISVLAGESAGSNNKIKMFKAGTYKLGDQEHANAIKDVVKVMKIKKIPFATNTLFVQALSKCLWVESFSVNRFKDKIKAHKSLFEKQPNIKAYLEEIEKIYNRQSKEKKPIAFLATEKSKQRHLSFGKI